MDINNFVTGVTTNISSQTAPKSIPANTVGQAFIDLANLTKTSVEAKFENTSGLTLQTQVSGLTTQVSGFTSQVSTLTTQSSGFTSQISTLTNQATGFTAQIAALNTQSSGFTSQISNLNTQSTGFTSQISSLNTQVSGLTTQISGVSPLANLTLSQTIPGVYLGNIAGTQAANATFNTKIFAYNGGDAYVSFTNTNVGRFIVFYDSGMNAIGGVSSTPISASTTFTDWKIPVAIPATTAFIGVSGLAANTLNATTYRYPAYNDFYSTTKTVSGNTTDITDIKNNKYEFPLNQLVTGSYIASLTAGDIRTASTMNVKYYAYSGGTAYLNFTTASNFGRAIQYLASDKLTVVGGISSGVIQYSTTYTDYAVTPPDGTAFIAISGINTSPLSVTGLRYAQQLDIDLLKKNTSSILSNVQTLAVDSTVATVYLDALGRESSTPGTYVRYFKYTGGNPFINFKASTLNRRVVFLNAARKILSVFGSDTLFSANLVYENYKLVDIPSDTAYIGITSTNDYQSFITTPVYSVRVDPVKSLILLSDSIGGYFQLSNAQIPNVVFKDKHIGGERTIDTLAVINAIPYMAEPFTIPALSTDTVNIDIYSKDGFSLAPNGTGGVTWTRGQAVNPAQNKYCNIGGVDGVLTCYRDTDPQGRSFVFRRNVSGSAVTFDRPIEVFNTDNLRNRNSIVICNMGTNGGFKAVANVAATEADADALVSQFKKVRDWISPQHNNYIFCGQYLLTNQGGWQVTKDWFDMYEAKMTKEFGQRFFSLRQYLLFQCFKDLNLTPNSTDIASLNQYNVPLTLIPDATHPSIVVGYAISNRLMERMQSLGMIDYYVPNALS